MTLAPLDRVPADRRDAAGRAIVDAFGNKPLEGVSPLFGGASAQIFKIEVAGRPYVLRLEAPADRMRDPKRTYPCMSAAAEAGIAPRQYAADIDAGIVIMDFIDLRPMATYPGGPTALVRAQGDLIGRLQELPPFPAYADYPLVIGQIFAFVKGSGLIGPALLDPHEDGFRAIREAYHWDPSSLVASHNDPNPRNMLFDGERLWLIDWELAFRNDPLVDLAILADNFAPTPELAANLLEARFGHPPDRLMSARLTLMRQMTRLFYASIILSMWAAALPAEPDTDLSAPTPQDFMAMVMDGRLTPGHPETTYLLGKMFLGGFLAGLSAPGYAEALAICRQG